MNQIWTSFSSIYIELERSTVKLNTKKTRKNYYAPYFTNEPKVILKKKEKFYKMNKLNYSDEANQELMKTRKITKSLMRKNRRNYELMLAGKAKFFQKIFFQHANKSKKVRQIIGPMKNAKGGFALTIRL